MCQKKERSLYGKWSSIGYFEAINYKK